MKHLRLLMSVLVVLAAFSCNKTSISGNGQVVFEVANDESVVDVTKSNVSDYTSLPSTGDFTITVKGTDFNWTGKVSEWDSTQSLDAGNYTVTASYGSLETEGFDKPYFASDETSFAVVGGQTTAVKINVALANTVVLVSCTDEFKSFYSDYTFTLTREGLNSSIATFVKDETRGAFVDGYKLTLNGELTANNGSTKSFTTSYTNLKAATAYTCVFGINQNTYGKVSITITFDDTVQTIDLGDKELND